MNSVARCAGSPGFNQWQLDWDGTQDEYEQPGSMGHLEKIIRVANQSPLSLVICANEKLTQDLKFDLWKVHFLRRPAGLGFHSSFCLVWYNQVHPNDNEMLHVPYRLPTHMVGEFPTRYMYHRGVNLGSARGWVYAEWICTIQLHFSKLHPRKHSINLLSFPPQFFHSKD